MNNVDVDTLLKSQQSIKKNPAYGYKLWTTNVLWIDSLSCQLSTRDFSTVPSDIGQPLGGNDTAPTPIEYLLNAAGSCFATTFIMLASQENIKIHSLSIDILSDFSASPFLGLADDYAGINNTVFKASINADTTNDKILEVAEIALSRSPVVASLKNYPKLVMI